MHDPNISSSSNCPNSASSLTPRKPQNVLNNLDENPNSKDAFPAAKRKSVASLVSPIPVSNNRRSSFFSWRASSHAPALDPSLSSYLKMAVKKPQDDKNVDTQGRKRRRLSIGTMLLIPPMPKRSEKMSLREVIKLAGIATGLIYGDTATAPMFVLKHMVHSDFNETAYELQIMGFLSIIIWITIILGAIKYVGCVVQADNNGEGGTLALISMLPSAEEESAPVIIKKFYRIFFTAALLGCGFILADGLITSPISVVAAVEGLSTIDSVFDDLVIPIACAILFALFYSQQYGTGKASRVFIPLMIVWFIIISSLGLYRIIETPRILSACNPLWILHFVSFKGAKASFSTLSDAVLAITGLETIYADIGSYKRKPIYLSFLTVVVPAIILNYLGQGALLLNAFDNALPSKNLVVGNPFFYLPPSWLRLPLVLFATLVSAIASQGTISGCFSLVDQAISLRAFPPVETYHIVKDGHESVYVPILNKILLLGGLVLVIVFQKGDSITNLYGLCVAGAMTITSILFILVMKFKWKTKMTLIVLFMPILALDTLLFISTLTKVVKFAWVAIIISLFFFFVMFVWHNITEEIKNIEDNDLWNIAMLRQHVRTHPRITNAMGVFFASGDEGNPNSNLVSKLRA
ncbi:potassium transporter-domain-containing protein [Paraphysoderma sedebokerense]|nr:potassium transporter-domain-containing protein [Paraphysoderma sedebokerense]KAI9138202.1 potassium transporter-domain-containing protein [Paraphysoderma sedebokerense]